MPENSEKTALERSDSEGFGDLIEPETQAQSRDFEVEPGTIVAQFLSRCVLDPGTRCWIWKGKISHGRAPIFMVYGRSMSALRASWELFRGEPPAGGRFKRLCGCNECVNPAHLTHAMHDTGEKSGPAARQGRKLSVEAIMEIRSSTKSKAFLAKKLGVSEWTIWAVRRGIRGKIVPVAPKADPQMAKEIRRREFVLRAKELLKDLRNGA